MRERERDPFDDDATEKQIYILIWVGGIPKDNDKLIDNANLTKAYAPYELCFVWSLTLRSIKYQSLLCNGPLFPIAL